MSVDKDYLKRIVEATDAGQPIYVGQVQGQPMLTNQPPLIEIETSVTNPADPTQVLCRALPAAKDWLAAQTNGSEKAVSNYQVMTGVELPPAKKRGNTSGSGAPTKYPFADMVVGGTFFSGNSEHKHKDAVKGLSSTVSAQNDKYSEPTGEKKTVTRAKRDPITKKAQIGPDGKKVTETVELDVKKYNRKFTIRAVAKGWKSGTFEAPEDGALVGRIL